MVRSAGVVAHTRDRDVALQDDVGLRRDTVPGQSLVSQVRVKDSAGAGGSSSVDQGAAGGAAVVRRR